MLLKREKSTLRMGIALFLTLAFAAYICFFAEKHYTQPHRTFSALLAAVAELGGARAPHFILQPIVGNSLLHGLKNKGCRGGGTISAHKTPEGHMETCARGTGSGFAEEKKAAVDEMPRDCAKQAPKRTGNSTGIRNVQKRIKLLRSRTFGLWYTEHEEGGATAHILLPPEEEAS